MINAAVSDAVLKLLSGPVTADRLRGIVLDAVMAERERYARIAEQSVAWGSVTARRIAADIRRPPP